MPRADGVICELMTRPTAAFTARCLFVVAMTAATLVTACRSSSAPPARTVSADAWATVNGVDITREEVEKEFRRLRNTTETLSDEDLTLARLSAPRDQSAPP